MKNEKTFADQVYSLGDESLAMARRLALSAYPGLPEQQQLEKLAQQLRTRYSTRPNIADLNQLPLSHLWAESILDAIHGDLQRSGFNRLLLVTYSQGPMTPSQVAATDGIGKYKGRDTSLHSAAGRSRHAASEKVRQYVIAEYNAKPYKSARQAAMLLKSAALAHAEAVGFHMSENNAFDTVWKWIRASKKR